MKKTLKFKSCAKGGEFTVTNSYQPASYWYVGIEKPSNIEAYINSCYASDPDLSGKVTGFGYGWQKYVVDFSGTYSFSVRGAAGGSCMYDSATMDPVTGVITGYGNRGGRGAKLEGTCYLEKGDILYMLVGMRGWSNCNGSDYGAGGGGASVVLKDNVNGDYTLTPLNRRVDVLFVAGGGGGCYDSSFDVKYYGRDAVYQNGTNTNGGSSSSCRGGAGLTGNGTSGSGGNASPSILSGNPQSTNLYDAHYGGWGGGGGSYDGGGGGGGYSGGNAYSNTYGDGGTSYINPNLCSETFRGYATVEDDSERNLTNPWTAYGFIEIQYNYRQEDKYILAQDSGGYKWFNGERNIDNTVNTTFSNEWELLTDQSAPTKDTFETYGKTIITNSTGLQDNVRFLISSLEPNETISIQANVNGAIVEMNKDINLYTIEKIKEIKTELDLTNANIRFAVSKDYGNTYQTYNSGNWDNIDISDKVEFQNNGFDIAQIGTIPEDAWKNYNPKSLRFALCITTSGRTNILVTFIKLVVDYMNSWKKYTEEDATYEYKASNMLSVTFFKTGNYKVNYLDSISNN